VGIDPFEERLSRVRHRFASTLEGKIQDIYTDLPLLSGEGKSADAVEVCYRRVHGICGIGPTVGFVQTGRTARDAEAVLLEAYRARRPLTESEAAAFRKKLHVLREAAKSELQTTLSGLR
jgi:chemotaxis protein histidine kinase CheA